MFDVGWSELVVIGVVALIAIGPKELPGVLRMVGQWMGKVRRMAAEFQGQFNEAMREAEMADLKKSFDEIKDTATSLSKNNILTSLTQEASDALKVGDLNAPASPASTSSEPVAQPAETAMQVEAQVATQVETYGAASEPLAITSEAVAAPVDAAATPAVEVGAADRYLDADLRRDAKAS